MANGVRMFHLLPTTRCGKFYVTDDTTKCHSEIAQCNTGCCVAKLMTVELSLVTLADEIATLRAHIYKVVTMKII